MPTAHVGTSVTAAFVLVVVGCGSPRATVPDASPDAPSTATDASHGTDVVADAVTIDHDANADSSPAHDATTTPARTAGGVTLPAGWTLHAEDLFGTAATQNVRTLSALHARYYEGQAYNRDASGLVRIPNVVINDEQETYSHFETAIVLASDHLTIQARGHSDGSITSGEIVSLYHSRSFCIEGRYQIPSADKAWPALWWYGDADGHDASEMDFEQPITPDQGVHDVSLHNHPTEGTVDILDSHFTTAYMTWSDPGFDASAAPHTYTGCYDDVAGVVSRYIDGQPIYTAVWRWNATLGGTGHGPDAYTIVNLAVGGSWPGNVANPATYSADLDLYSLRYYGP